MKAIFIFAALLGTYVGWAQAPEIPTKELAKLEFMLGKWEGEDTIYSGAQGVKSKGSAETTKTAGGRYIHAVQTYELTGMKIEGLHLLTFDPSKKKYRTWYVDSTSSEAIVFTGDFEGSKLVLVSDPVSIGGLPNGTVMRATYWQDAGKNHFLLEMKSGEKFEKIITSVYSKKA